jgi:hypothetical protein
MSRDIEVSLHLVGSLEELLKKLEKAVAENKIEETNKIKSLIIEINKRLIEEAT